MIALCSSQTCQGHELRRAVEKPNQPKSKDYCIDCGEAIRWVRDRKVRIHYTGTSQRKQKRDESMFAGGVGDS